jgi:hypothetical protein
VAEEELRNVTPEQALHVPGTDDEYAGIRRPANLAGLSDDAVGRFLSERFTNCITRGSHQLARSEDPVNEPVIVCQECYRYWRAAVFD